MIHMTQATIHTDAAEVIEDIVEAISDNPQTAIPFITIAIKALGDDFVNDWWIAEGWISHRTKAEQTEANKRIMKKLEEAT